METGPFVRTSDPAASHVAARRTVTREGEMGQVRSGTHRHRLLSVLRFHPGTSQEEAGKIAFDVYGVGDQTKAGSDVGRRRCDDLEAMGLIQPSRCCAHCDAAVDEHGKFQFPDKKTTPWKLTQLGLDVLRRLETCRVVKVPYLR